MELLRNSILIAVSSAAGGVCRYLAGRLASWLSPGTHVLPTLSVNIAGCFIMGYIMGMAGKSNALPPSWVLMLTTGFCGGFTTFSAFAFENIVWMRSGDYSLSILYICASIVFGILSTWAGLEFAR